MSHSHETMPVYVTKSVLPPLSEYVGKLEKIWESGHLTNNGACVRELEGVLAAEFGVKHCMLVSNATLGLQIAIKALGLKGEILTTPFSFVATASSIVWEGCVPRFADIDPDTLCLSPERLRERMREGVAAILPTHVFGNPCDVEAIDEIAREWDVPVIYDAAHTYGVELNGKNVMQFGDVSILSLHATKLFHSVEGGVVATNDDELAEKIRSMRNFGFDGPEAFQGLGTNAKMSELHAAMGLVIHPRMREVIVQRQQRVDRYDALLGNLPGVRQPSWNPDAGRNAAYYPIILESEAKVLEVMDALAEVEVYARRYFYPSLTKLPYAPAGEMEVAEDIAQRILCLPLYPELALDEVERIAECLKGALIG